MCFRFWMRVPVHVHLCVRMYKVYVLMHQVCFLCLASMLVRILNQNTPKGAKQIPQIIAQIHP